MAQVLGNVEGKELVVLAVHGLVGEQRDARDLDVVPYALPELHHLYVYNNPASEEAQDVAKQFIVESRLKGGTARLSPGPIMPIVAS